MAFEARGPVVLSNQATPRIVKLYVAGFHVVPRGAAPHQLHR